MRWWDVFFFWFLLFDFIPIYSFGIETCRWIPIKIHRRRFNHLLVLKRKKQIRNLKYSFEYFRTSRLWIFISDFVLFIPYFQISMNNWSVSCIFLKPLYNRRCEFQNPIKSRTQSLQRDVRHLLTHACLYSTKQCMRGIFQAEVWL